MYCSECAHPIEEGKSTCARCGHKVKTKRSRIQGKTIVIICLSVALLAAIVFFSLRILGFLENPVRPEIPAEHSLEPPPAPTSPPAFPVDPEGRPQAEPQAARVNASGGLRMREGPGVDYDVVILIPNYAHIAILEEAGGWALVEYRGASGWVSAEFLLSEDDDRFWDEPEESVVTPGNRSPDPSPVRINAEGGLRMRMGPGVEYHVVMIIPNDEVAPAHDESGEWVYIEYLGHWGWVNTAFLLDE